MTFEDELIEITDSDEETAENITKIILEFIELDSDKLLYKDILIDGVEEIDFTKPDAWIILAKLIETYSTSTESKFEMVTSYCISLVEGGKTIEYVEQNPKTHEDVELALEEPWKSSALRKLWKTITCYEFKFMLEIGGGLSMAEDILNLVLLVTDEEAYVPYVDSDEWATVEFNDEMLDD